MTSEELHRLPVGTAVYLVNDTHGLDTLTRQEGDGWKLRLSPDVLAELRAAPTGTPLG